MSEFNTTEYVNEARGLRSYITGVFVKMGLALTITALMKIRLQKRYDPDCFTLRS